MDFTGTILYILLGIASFALVGFLAWATFKGGREGSDGDGGEPPIQPGRPPEPPTESVPMTPEEEMAPAGRA